MLTNLKPISIVPAREKAAASLRKAILSKELLPGEELTLESVAVKLGLSITPVREAFQLLERDGLIALRHNKGAIILGIDEKKVRDHYEARMLIEKEIVRRACKSNGDYKKVIESYEGMKREIKLGKLDENYTYDQMFHYGIWDLCGNLKLRSIAAELWNAITIKNTFKEHVVESNRQHGLILQGLMEGNEELCAKMMERHISDCMEAALKIYREGPAS